MSSGEEGGELEDESVVLCPLAIACNKNAFLRSSSSAACFFRRSSRAVRQSECRHRHTTIPNDNMTGMNMIISICPIGMVVEEEDSFGIVELEVVLCVSSSRNGRLW